jgi:hypothetical protein
VGIAPDSIIRLHVERGTVVVLAVFGEGALRVNVPAARAHAWAVRVRAAVGAWPEHGCPADASVYAVDQIHVGNTTPFDQSGAYVGVRCAGDVGADGARYVLTVFEGDGGHMRLRYRTPGDLVAAVAAIDRAAARAASGMPHAATKHAARASRPSRPRRTTRPPERP